MINIYFAGSIRGGRELADVYNKLISFLGSMGNVFTEHVGDNEILEIDDLSDNEIFERDMEWIRNSDLMIAEVSQPSLGVGFEIASAIELGIQVLCLYRNNAEHRLSAMIAGCKNVTVLRYNSIEEAETKIADYISGLSRQEA